MKNVTIPQVGDSTINRALQALASEFNSSSKKFIENYTIQVSVKASVSTAIDHKLGRVPQGFVVSDATGDIRVWRTAASTATQIFLQSSVDGTVTILLF
jgi:hypothetical protein